MQLNNNQPKCVQAPRQSSRLIDGAKHCVAEWAQALHPTGMHQASGGEQAKLQERGARSVRRAPSMLWNTVYGTRKGESIGMRLKLAFVVPGNSQGDENVM
jgi:hypothetical protein